MCLLSPFKGRRYVVVLQQGGSCQKAKGANSLSRSRPPDPIFEDPIRSPNHNSVIAKFFEPHKLRSSLGLPFLHSLRELRVCAIVAVQLPEGAASLVTDSPAEVHSLPGRLLFR
jgi:hypothetical protein